MSANGASATSADLEDKVVSIAPSKDVLKSKIRIPVDIPPCPRSFSVVTP